MPRLPKVLVTLFMMFALILQASAGSVCAIGCLFGGCGSKQVLTTHQDHDDDHGSCCDHEKNEFQGRSVHGNTSQIASEHKDACGCPVMASCDSAVPSTSEMARVQVTNVDLPVILAETLTINFARLRVPEPGHYGNDSGPPLRRPIDSLSSRAPPVA